MSPLPQRTLQWTHSASTYIGSVSILAKESPLFWLPLIQLTGQAVESALKGRLAAANIEPPTKQAGQNLIHLYKMADERLSIINPFSC